MRQPTYIVALLSSMFGYAVMTLVMAATPLAMNACGYGFNDSATVIQAHSIAMFLPSFFTGYLIARFGVLRIIAIGAIIQVGCAVINLAGIDFWNFFFANILVGLGWNFAFVGGTTLLTETYRPAERAKAQGTHDLIVYGATASAALGSGLLQAGPGWWLVNVMALPLMVVVFCAATVARGASEARSHRLIGAPQRRRATELIQHCRANRAPACRSVREFHRRAVS